jgi:hypothetical protein
MITMGLRAAPKSVTFAIYDSEAGEVVNVEDILVPAAFEFPEALKYIRSNILDVLRLYGVEKAGVRTTEPVAQSPSLERIQIEGVIQETFASSTMTGYFAGPIAVVCSALRVERTVFKPMVQQGRNDLDVANWEGMSEAKREAVLCALGAVNA